MKRCVQWPPFPKPVESLFPLLKVGGAQQGRSSWKAPKCSHCPFLPPRTPPALGNRLRGPVLGALHPVVSSSLPHWLPSPHQGGKENLKTLAVRPGNIAEPGSSTSGMTKLPSPPLRSLLLPAALTPAL